MITPYFDDVIAIISVVAPLLGLLFNFYVSRISIKLRDIQLIDTLEKALEKESNEKLAELNREKLECLRFKQATGYSEQFRALRKLFCDEQNKLSISQFRAMRVLCKIKNDVMVGFDWFAYLVVFFGFFIEIFFVIHGIRSAVSSPYYKYWIIVFFTALLAASWIFLNVLIRGAWIYARRLKRIT